MYLSKSALIVVTAFGLAACSDHEQFAGRGFSSDKTRDGGFDKKHLSKLQAGIWVDPNGCHHWIIDDGVEGYLSARLDRHGKPVCTPIAKPNQTVGDFKGGSNVYDPN